MGEPPRPRAPDRGRRDTPTQLAAPAAGAERKAGQMIAGKYELKTMIATGGMGSVWEALDTQLERKVAIKFMSPVIAHDAHARQRFNREAKAAAKLTTPHVVQVFEHGLDKDQPFIVMELLQGRDLHTRLRREKRINLEEAARIVAQIAKGLRAAHEKNIIHRDLKPHNVFLAKVDGELVVKILDFGVAKMDDNASEGTKTGVLLGSPHYMSPEQARGKSNIDHRSDIWSLAVITFRMITGKMAFHGEGQGDVIIAIATADIPVPSQVNKNIPPQIDAFFERALVRERAKRFPTAVDLATAFAEAVRDATEASLLTPATGHPLHPGPKSEHPMETTQLLPEHEGVGTPHLGSRPVAVSSNDLIAGQQTPAPRPPMPSFASNPAHPMPAASQPGVPPSQRGPLTSMPSEASLHTPATGPSIGTMGNQIFSAPPPMAPTPERRMLGLIAIVTAGLIAVAIFAAVGLSGDESASAASASSAEAVEPTPAPEPVADPTPKPADEPAADTTAEPSAEPAAEPSAEPSAAPSAAAPEAPKPKTWTQPKPKPGGWDDFGY